MKQENNGVWTSWNENLTYKYKSLYRITTEKELQEVVAKTDKMLTALLIIGVLIIWFTFSPLFLGGV